MIKHMFPVLYVNAKLRIAQSEVDWYFILKGTKCCQEQVEQRASVLNCLLRKDSQISAKFQFRQNIISVTLVFSLETEMFQEMVSTVLCRGFSVGRGGEMGL